MLGGQQRCAFLNHKENQKTDNTLADEKSVSNNIQETSTMDGAGERNAAGHF